MNWNIELVRYRRFGEELLLFQLLTSATERLTREISGDSSVTTGEPSTARPRSRQKTVTQHLADADQNLVDLYESVKAYLLALGDDVQTKTLDNYLAFSRLKNFAGVEVKPQIRHLKVFVKVDPDSIDMEPGFIRDVRNIGHFGSGDLEIIITDVATLDPAKPFWNAAMMGRDWKRGPRISAKARPFNRAR